MKPQAHELAARAALAQPNKFQANSHDAQTRINIAPHPLALPALSSILSVSISQNYVRIKRS